LLGPEAGFVLPRPGRAFRVKGRLPAKYPSLQGPRRERTLLLVVVTARSVAERLGAALGDQLKAYPERRQELVDRVRGLVREMGQEWLVLGAVTLVPDGPRK
jgi:hypothetical protein